MQSARWDGWRPTISLFAHEKPALQKLELLIANEAHRKLAACVAADVQSIRPSAQVFIHQLSIADPWSFVQVYAGLHGFAKAYQFEEDTDYFVHLTTGTHVFKICLFLLLEARYFPARIVESFANNDPSHPAWHGRLEVIDLDLAAYDQLAQRFSMERLDSQGLLKGGIETRNAAFNTLIGRMEKVALASSAPILLSGPTGAGKSLLAKRIFELRKRRHLVNGQFVEVNCTTLRGDNAMSALFGHKKGVFTGAVSDRAGLLNEADKGILFLDEIAELGLDEQAMLLRAIEDKRFRALGAEKEIGSDFQLICGSNQNLKAQAAQGLFRSDLLARINLWDFTLPGLKDRREDIEPNLIFETERVSQQLGARVSWSAQAMQRFLEFALGAPWPGNFRDLSSAVTRMATLANGHRITLEDVQQELVQIERDHAVNLNGDGRGLTLVRKVLSPEKIGSSELLDLKTLEAVLEVVMDCGNMAEAGRKLFAFSRLQKASSNDSDWVRKYLVRWDLKYQACRNRLRNL